MTQDSSSQPEPLVFDVGDGAVHGQIWHGGDTWAVLVHESGQDRDLDCWRNLPALLAQAGHSVLSFDLPGHGLSGGKADARQIALGTEAALRLAAERDARRRFLVAAGDSAGPAFKAILAEPVDALVLLSPHVPDESFTLLRSIRSPKLILAGLIDADVPERAQRESRGWAVVSRFGCPQSGTDLLDGPWGDQVREQILLSLGDCRS